VFVPLAWLPVLPASLVIVTSHQRGRPSVSRIYSLINISGFNIQAISRNVKVMQQWFPSKLYLQCRVWQRIVMLRVIASQRLGMRFLQPNLTRTPRRSRGMRATAWGLAIAVLGYALSLPAQAYAKAAYDTTADGSALAAKLSRHYRLASAKLSPKGAPGMEPGEILKVRMDGIVGFAAADQSLEQLCPSEFSAGTLHEPKSVLCTVTSPHGRKTFQVSDPVCVTAVSVSQPSDSVSLYLIACDARKSVMAPPAYYALVVFRFPKGSLRTISPARVEEVLDEVVSSSTPAAPPPSEPGEQENSDHPQSAPDSVTPAPGTTPVDAGKDAPEQDHPEESQAPALKPVSAPPADRKDQIQGVQKEPAAPSPAEQTDPPLDPVPPPTASGTPSESAQPGAQESAAQPPAEQTVPPLDPVPPPASNADPPNQPEASPNAPAQASSTGKVVAGQSVEQVEALLGAPHRVAKVGSKTIYFYAHLKVQFVDGKVSEVQQLETNQ
jgi:hypothetical protein